MTTPVFVIHGIGNRDESAFGRTVDALADAIGGITAYPIYWGDLGAEYEWITHTVPGVAEVRDRGPESRDQEDGVGARFLLADSRTRDGAETRDTSAVPDELIDAVIQALTSAAGRRSEVRGAAFSSDAVAVKSALAAAWPATTWLPLSNDAELLSSVGAAIAGPIADGAATHGGTGVEVRGAQVRGLDISAFVRKRLQEIDRVVGAAIGGAAGRLNSNLRNSFLPGITRGIGDILVYQRHREAISERMRRVISDVDPELGRTPDHPVDIVAHSLGGVITVDIATSVEPLWIRRLVTFGSQSPFFHVCDPRGGALTSYIGRPVQLPDSIGAWSNLWEPLDPVAFIADRVFRLSDGSKPKDVKIAHLASSGVWTHTDYWTLQDVIEAIGQGLR
ncbi:hypothetical protein [Nocardia sp. NPDC060249]|uniref:hypothetical protein n=1 Tax=Nocardia sp. NPDC060249 TaxID=3347082 RepID=UPI00365F441A